MTLFHIGFLDFTIIDFIDVLLVGYFFYRFLLLVRNIRSLELLIGILMFFLIGMVSYWLELSMVQWFISNIAAFGIVVLVVILQPELRRSFVRLGQNRLLRYLLKPETRSTVEDLMKAVEKLADLHYGALIVLENKMRLSAYAETGKEMNANLSHELLESIFTPHTPLHDGAVIIRGDQLVAASCTLPLSQNPAYARLYGMRHKAAVGLAEETDALVIVVSEETGQISYAHEGKLIRNITPSELRGIIQDLYSDQ